MKRKIKFLLFITMLSVACTEVKDSANKKKEEIKHTAKKAILEAHGEVYKHLKDLSKQHQKATNKLKKEAQSQLQKTQEKILEKLKKDN